MSPDAGCYAPDYYGFFTGEDAEEIYRDRMLRYNV